MVQFNDWCNSADASVGNHRLRVMTGRPADTAVGVQVTASAVPGHYAAEERIARALTRLRKPEAARVITDLLPQTPQIRSGDLGEIYATEWINAHSGYRAPIKRLRWKDHRDMAMRGDDVIGMILEIPGEKADKRERARKDWERHLATLDTAILSLIGEADVPDHGIEAALDAILQSSLWQRRLLRVDDASRTAYRSALLTRSRYIWARSTPATRRGYFLAGLGLEAGHALDAVAPEANELLIQANGALLAADAEAAILAITTLAERVFAFYPFTPDPFPDNWRAILRCWLLGQPLAGLVAGQEGDALQFIEGGLVYRLPWAMEALRVRAAANGDVVGQFGLALNDYELGLAVPAVETGTMNRSASILIQAGFSSRLAAIKAVTDAGATFTTGQELRTWLRSPEVAALSAQPDWPTPETRAMWVEFTQEYAPRDNRTWAERRYRGQAQWYGVPPPPGVPVTLHHWNGQPLVLSGEGLPIGRLNHPLNPQRRGLVRVTVAADPGQVDLSYLGPDDLWVA